MSDSEPTKGKEEAEEIPPPKSSSTTPESPAPWPLPPKRGGTPPPEPRAETIASGIRQRRRPREEIENLADVALFTAKKMEKFPILLTCVVVCVVSASALGYLVFTSGPPSTFPRDFATFTEREARLARKIPGDTVGTAEITEGRLSDGVLLQDMVDVLTQHIVYHPKSMALPIYYGEDHNYAALAFMGDRGPTVFLNPNIHKSSGAARITQQPRFCSMARGYLLPTRVVVSGTYHNSTTIVRQEFQGAHAALAYTMIHQLKGDDVCDPEWE